MCQHCTGAAFAAVFERYCIPHCKPTGLRVGPTQSGTVCSPRREEGPLPPNTRHTYITLTTTRVPLALGATSNTQPAQVIRLHPCGTFQAALLFAVPQKMHNKPPCSIAMHYLFLHLLAARGFAFLLSAAAVNAQINLPVAFAATPASAPSLATAAASA